jgi:hypothetical protein
VRQVVEVGALADPGCPLGALAYELAVESCAE